MADDAVYVGRGNQKRKARWPFLVILAVVALLAVGAGLWFRWHQTKNEASFKPDQLPGALQDVQELTLAGDQAGAEMKINESLADPSTPPDVKFSLYMQQGANYYDAGDYQKAKASYEAAFAIKQTFELAQALATTLTQLGDKQGAIDYLKKAKELMPSSNPVREDDLALIDQQIADLEAGL